MPLLKHFCNDIDSNKESDVAPASPSANALLPAKRRKTTLKRRKWNDDYLNYGFRHQKKILIHLLTACFARPYTVMLMLLDQNF